MRFKFIVMSSNSKIIIVSLVILATITVAGFWLYKHRHPVRQSLPPRAEIKVTIIPGWNLRQIAEDWVKKGIIKDSAELFSILGQPAYNYTAFRKTAPVLDFSDASGTDPYPLLKTRPDNISYEGYLFPDTYQVYADASSTDVLKKIFDNLEKKITPEMRAQMQAKGLSFSELLTLASIVEKEASSNEDMNIVADIFQRRLKKHWALQSCATVNYITGKFDPGVSTADKEIDSPYNTYKYPGLPPGPISNPSLTAIKAVLNPEPNDYWYFMTGTDGVTRFAKTLEEHNYNVHKYLK